MYTAQQIPATLAIPLQPQFPRTLTLDADYVLPVTVRADERSF